MFSLVTYRRQHDEIRSCLDLLGEVSEQVRKPESARQAAALLASISSLVLLHLIAEDHFLFPSLTNHADQNVRTIAALYLRTGRDLRQDFMRYAEQWGELLIHAEPDRFYRETQEILARLHQRIEQEDRNLYPLILV